LQTPHNVVATINPGDLVSTILGWREWFNAPVGTLQKLDTFGLPPQALLGVAGMTGLTDAVSWLALCRCVPGNGRERSCSVV
jgi:NADPH-dependent curcumin reductase CurA